MHKIYIIDDEPHKRSWLRLLLSELGKEWEAGFQNATAAINDAGQLLAAARSGPGNVVLFDIHMKRQAGVAEQLVVLLRGSSEGTLGDELYGEVNDTAYRLACYIYAACVHSKTPVFSISTMENPQTSIRCHEEFERGLPKLMKLTWPNNMRLPVKPGEAQLRLFKENAAKVRTQIDPYQSIKVKCKALERRIQAGETWPPHMSAQLFTADPWHRLGPGSEWASLRSVPGALVKKLNAAFCDLCTPLPGARGAFPDGTGGVCEYWPLLAAKGFHDGKISLRFIEWLLDIPATPKSSHLHAFQAPNDENHAEVIAALCILAAHEGSNGERFSVTLGLSGENLVFTFSAKVDDSAAISKKVEEINSSPEKRATEPGRNGNPGIATLARHKLETLMFPENFRATKDKQGFAIRGQVKLQELR